MSETEVRQRIDSVPHWYHRIELAPGIVTPGVNDSPAFLRALEDLGLPQDCSGMRVLDVGARDGYFSFELERRGAEVVALDYAPPETTGFLVARELVGSQVEYRVGNVYDLDPATFGKFDQVLFLGVLYHLRNPLLALDRIWSVCSERMWIESHVIDHGFLESVSGNSLSLAEVAPRIASEPIMQFFPRDALNGDYSNWWGPNMACLKEMVAMANFSVDGEMLLGARGMLACRVTNDSEVEHQRRIERSTVV